MNEDKKNLEMDRQQIIDIVARTGKLLPAFEMAYNKGNVGLFREFIHKYKLQEEFVQNCLEDIIKLEGVNKRKCYMKIAEEEGVKYLTKRYGDKFGNKLENEYKNGKINYMDIYQVSNINQDGDIKEQSDIMMKILDLCKNDDLEIGLHRTGGAVSGETLNKEGIKLTGNISSGAKNKFYADTMSRLEDNITFDNHFGTLLYQIANGGSYKNYFNKKFIDIAIVAIPKSQLKEKSIIKKHGNFDILNPSFIKGYITVNTKNSTMIQYVENPMYVLKEDSKTPSNILKQTIEATKAKVVFSGIQQLIRKIKRRVQTKDKNIERSDKDEGNR